MSEKLQKWPKNLVLHRVGILWSEPKDIRTSSQKQRAQHIRADMDSAPSNEQSITIMQAPQQTNHSNLPRDGAIGGALMGEMVGVAHDTTTVKMEF